jgi:hypothetical protein
LPFANRYLPRLLAENTAYTQMERMSGTWGIQSIKRYAVFRRTGIQRIPA